MTSSVIWVERGSDGRHYYVRKKSKTPSARELLSDLLAPLRKNSSPFSRAYQRDHHILPAPLDTPLYLPAPPVPPTTWTPLPTVPPTHQPPSGPSTRAMNHSPRYSHKHRRKESDGGDPRGILKPQHQTYSLPHPTMYPAPPPNAMPIPQQPGFDPFPPQNQMLNQIHHMPTQPPGAYSSQPLPHGARIVSPPRYPTAEELKYKCTTCGRLRSARYHYKHALPPGQLPGVNICHKCQKEATDSEESTTSSDSRRDCRGYRQRSRSQSRAVPRGLIPHRSRSRRGRSLGREEWSDNEYEEATRDTRRSYSRSSSLDLEPLRTRSRRTRSRRPRSPSVEVIRYIERRPCPQVTRRIIYVENERPRSEEDYFWDEAGGDFEHRPSRRHQSISRPPCQSPQVIRYRVSNPAMRPPLAIEHGRYFDDRDSSHDDYELAARPLSRAVSRMRMVSAPYRRSQKQEYVLERDEGFDDSAKKPSYRRPRSLMGRGGNTSRGSSMSRVYDQGHLRRNDASVLPYAPTPPGWNNRPEQAVIDKSRGRHSFDEHLEPPRHRSRSRARSRSHSCSVEHSQLTSGFLHPGEDATVVERHGSGSAEDYDWYDKDGMRVRVREI